MTSATTTKTTTDNPRIYTHKKEGCTNKGATTSVLLNRFIIAIRIHLRVRVYVIYNTYNKTMSKTKKVGAVHTSGFYKAALIRTQEWKLFKRNDIWVDVCDTIDEYSTTNSFI